MIWSGADSFVLFSQWLSGDWKVCPLRAERMSMGEPLRIVFRAMGENGRVAGATVGSGKMNVMGTSPDPGNGGGL